MAVLQLSIILYYDTLKILKSGLDIGPIIVDPQIQAKIKWSSVVVCSNRPALSGGMAIEEIKFAKEIGKAIIAVALTKYDNRELKELEVPIIPYRKDSLDSWIKNSIG